MAVISIAMSCSRLLSLRTSWILRSNCCRDCSGTSLRASIRLCECGMWMWHRAGNWTHVRSIFTTESTHKGFSARLSDFNDVMLSVMTSQSLSVMLSPSWFLVRSRIVNLVKCLRLSIMALADTANESSTNKPHIRQRLSWRSDAACFDWDKLSISWSLRSHSRKFKYSNGRWITFRISFRHPAKEFMARSRYLKCGNDEMNDVNFCRAAVRNRVRPSCRQILQFSSPRLVMFVNCVTFGDVQYRIFSSKSSRHSPCRFCKCTNMFRVYSHLSLKSKDFLNLHWLNTILWCCLRIMLKSIKKIRRAADENGIFNRKCEQGFKVQFQILLSFSLQLTSLA